ncbi:hypothetical protein G7075_18305 [Phycicoccus sp. HDW14]|uniref:hypothetical protein n=1 Tax=Phycicoccus sp. HDW14 TaxID=2714941 RepID=UPI001409F5D4|nr:hypothetical protein [Phycicoccus sp. HDW14]QIM22634.1 hypothetical protein G7075_18305 [Phycicoccus sp. HDW14]
MTPRTRATAALTTLLLAAGVAGCSGDGAEPTPTGSGAQQTVTAAPPTNQPAGAIKELSKVRCERKGKDWSFSATLTNAGSEKTTYTVLVAVAKREGGTVVGSKTLTKTLDAGDSATLEAEDFYSGDDKAADVQCVPSATKAKAG